MIQVQINNQPISLPIKYNGYYKLVLLLAIINYCANGKKACLELIHIVFWSLRTQENYKILLDFSSKRRETLTPWSFEYGIEQVLTLGFVYGYIQKKVIQDSLEIQITSSGEAVISKIKESEFFEEEIVQIQALGKIPKNRLLNANKHWTLI